MVKNKVAPPFRQAEFDLMHDRGISREGDLLDLAIEDKIVDKSGSWFNYGDMRWDRAGKTPSNICATTLP